MQKTQKMQRSEFNSINTLVTELWFKTWTSILRAKDRSLFIKRLQMQLKQAAKSERGDVPGWVLVVLMTTGLVTGIWTVAQPRLSSILKNSLDNMNSIR
ncbi:MAG: hypothetical protein HQ476_01575 [SAR202 cluster bacterium]|nr:hypothetical protein [SAR202 cluster bacterium]